MKVASHETRSAHRIAWAIHHDREPAPLLVRHACDNPACCNPAHLLLGTHQDNMDDKTARGRGRTGRQDGEHNGAAVLTEEQVGQIVQCFRDGLNNQQIARRFPVSDSLVSRIRTGRSWRKQSAAFGWEPRPMIAHPFCQIEKGAA
ncbi:HNH endonuclease signature motif containing protein [Sphingomonas sp. NIC1]|uniref:HNH endonuclease signature motif containing protein n=1 Tax=Sphingomonas sp. NIC1 TaxID=1961362 RepID=UPI0009975538|nr:HNH endonuclease signature motif containing protein [Sphingomonas sp. NIC1]